MKQVYLLSGRPGMGKTSLIKQAVASIKGKVGGFYTEEIRSQGERQGFRLVTLDGRRATLAHTDIHCQHRVGKYGVDIDSLDRIAVPALREAAEKCDLIIIDEIGKMELFSANLREVMLQIINHGKRALGTIMLSPNPWTDAIKRHPQVKVIELTRANYHQVREQLLDWLKAPEGAPS